MGSEQLYRILIRRHSVKTTFMWFSRGSDFAAVSFTFAHTPCTSLPWSVIKSLADHIKYRNFGDRPSGGAMFVYFFYEVASPKVIAAAYWVYLFWRRLIVNKVLSYAF